MTPPPTYSFKLTHEQAALQERSYDAAARKLGEMLAQGGLGVLGQIVQEAMGIIQLHQMLKAAAGPQPDDGKAETPASKPNGKDKSKPGKDAPVA